MAFSSDLIQFLAEQREAASINVEATDLKIAQGMADSALHENRRTLNTIRAMFIGNILTLDEALSKFGVVNQFDS